MANMSFTSRSNRSAQTRCPSIASINCALTRISAARRTLALQRRRPHGASSPSLFAYGSALNLDVYLYLLMPDGAYTFERDKPHFHHPPAPSPGELHELLNNVS